MKPFTVSAGLDAGKFEPDTVMGNFGKSVVVQGYEINTALDRGYGEENPTQILMNSDNVGMVSVAEQVGSETMHAYLESFGFGRRTGIDLEGEITTSLLPLKQWRDIHRATIAFGQGIAATPMQVITAYMMLINGGDLVRPQVVEKILKTDGSERPLEAQVVGHPIKAETSDKIRRMLERVVAEGQAKRAGVKGYRIGGKTGTAQVARPEGGYFEDKTIHSFVGFGPVEEPKFIALIKFDYPTNVRFAEGSAGLTFAEIAKFLFNYYQIAPTESVD
jgi:cell division protein FtsI (penicillin-binding protein 3)/stage V sporulation protein D (sporulation-specific penicillin-binding protein)